MLFIKYVLVIIDYFSLVWQDKPDNNIVWKNFTQNFTFLWSDLFVKDQKALRSSEDHDKTRDL